MYKIFPSLLIVALGLGCQRSEVTQRSGSANFGSAKTLTPPNPPTTITQNASLIEAVVDSVILVDEVHYRLSAEVRAANPVKGMASLAEAGQHMMVSPQYVQTQEGSIDYTHERNRNLLALRSARRGNLFTGKVALNAHGDWVLVEVVKH